MGRSYCHLQEQERSEISRLLSAGVSRIEIGRRLKRSASTICREIKRNAGAGGYLPVKAEKLALNRRHARRASKIERSSRLENLIRDRLAMGHSPEQIAGRLELTQPMLSISHESIYKFIHTAAGRRERLHNYLTQRKSRRGRRRRLGHSKPMIPDRTSISERPASIKNNLLFGHWEADLMSFQRHNAVILAEQRSRYVLAARQNDKTSATTAGSIGLLLAQTPLAARASITFDNGGEFARHRTLGLPSYFCDPHSPWQKGAVENAIGRLRRDLPTASRRADHSDTDFDAIIALYNDTPRKCLDWRTPAEAFRDELVSQRQTKQRARAGKAKTSRPLARYGAGEGALARSLSPEPFSSVKKE